LKVSDGRQVTPFTGLDGEVYQFSGQHSFPTRNAEWAAYALVAQILLPPYPTEHDKIKRLETLLLKFNYTLPMESSQGIWLVSNFLL
jgi:hypothetical protein